jgi:hypothetical protein
MTIDALTVFKQGHLEGWKLMEGRIRALLTRPHHAVMVPKFARVLQKREAFLISFRSSL